MMFHKRGSDELDLSCAHNQGSARLMSQSFRIMSFVDTGGSLWSPLLIDKQLSRLIFDKYDNSASFSRREREDREESVGIRRSLVPSRSLLVLLTELLNVSLLHVSENAASLVYFKFWKYYFGRPFCSSYENNCKGIETIFIFPPERRIQSRIRRFQRSKLPV